MSHPAPIPPPRDRKARRKLSPGQVAYLERKAVRDKAKAERKAKHRLDAWYLKEFHPEIAKARREKGIKNNAQAAAWRRQSFVESFADWPQMLAPGEMAYRIREWLRDPSRSFVNPKTGRRRWKWRGCEKHFVKTEASVRKKLTDLGVFRYNFRLRLWFKCGSVEEAEIAETNRKNAPAEEGWFDKIIHSCQAQGWRAQAEQIILRWCEADTLSDVRVGQVEHFRSILRKGYDIRLLMEALERECVAEAALVAD